MRFFPPTSNNNLKGTGLIFYCKDCEKIVDVFPVGRKFVYKCSICKTKNVAFGTDKSIRNFFRLPEEDKTVTVVAAPADASSAVTPPAPTAPVKPAGPVVAQNPIVAPIPASASSQTPAPTGQAAPQPAPKADSGPTLIPENK